MQTQTNRPTTKVAPRRVTSVTASPTTPNENWKAPIYLKGALIGVFFGVLGAYLFARAAEEDAQRNGGKPSSVPTMTMVSLALTALGLLRQIAEMGKAPAKK